MTSPPSEISFFVPGIAKPGGSKRAFINRHTGRASIVDACKNTDWKTAVVAAAREAYRDAPMIAPLSVSFRFTLTRPKGHYGTGKNADKIKPSAPAHPTSRPDTTKLVRCAEDALTGIIWKDDAQIVEQFARKWYGGTPGCHITVVVLEARWNPKSADSSYAQEHDDG